MSFGQALARVPTRCNFTFAPDGCHVARIVNRDGDFAVEACELGTDLQPEPVYGDDPMLCADTRLTFPSGDRILMFGDSNGWCRIVEAHRVDAAAGWRSEPIAELQATGLTALPCLEGVGWQAVISWTDDNCSTIWRIEQDQPRLVPMVRVPGVVTSGAWLEPARRLVANISEPGRTTSGYVIDLVEGSYHRWLHVSDHSNDRVALCDSDRGILGITSEYFGYSRVGVVDLADPRKVCFFADLPLDVDLCGLSDRQLILRRQRGVVSELLLGDPVTLRVSGPLRLPVGFVDRPVVRSGNYIRFPFSAPTVPTVCASYLPTKAAFRLEETPDLGDLDAANLSPARICRLPGPRGDIETLIYEPSPSRACNVVVVALHGGPVAQWSATFTPELQLFAGLGAVVAAPNYRGSAGYGDEFVRVLEGAGGSVDVDDVVAVTTAMQEATGSERTVTILYGHSYGAYLALLVAAARPELCEGVIAVAPFTSLASMGAVGGPSVQRLIALLHDPVRGHETDLLRRCPAFRARLLIAHGAQDDVIPIEQSKALCDRLQAHGYRDGRNLWFLRLPGEGHTITSRAAVLRLYEHIESFFKAVTSAGRGARDHDRRRSTWQGGVHSLAQRDQEEGFLCDTVMKGGAS